ncbi:MAG: TIGR00303 family protein [Thaumarchaeota archaeon]|nr:TIGR00303 family protein [Nitrososphaerota archaeon]
MKIDIDIFGNYRLGECFIDDVFAKKFFFALIISYTETCKVPGITMAGSAMDLMELTSPSDAEFINYGYCKNMAYIPMTPDGKPTPAIITKTMLDKSNIPHITINSGSKIAPKIPYIETSIPYGNNIFHMPGLDIHSFLSAINYGKIMGNTLSLSNDCLVIGESIPGGTTTALAVLKGLGINAQVSSSMPNNPLNLKNKIVNAALSRLNTKDPFSMVSNLGDPMIPFVAGMVSTASKNANVILAGGTQMAAVLALAKHVGYEKKKLSLATTQYVINDQSANFTNMVKQIDDLPIFTAKLKLENSKHSAIRSYSDGFVKDGAGAGGATVAAILYKQFKANDLLDRLDKNYCLLLNSY